MVRRPMLSPLETRRSPAEALFRPRSIAVFGEASSTGQRIVRNLRETGFPGAIHLSSDAERLTQSVDLGIIAGDFATGLAALAASDIAVAVAVSEGEPGVGPIRLLGPRSFGIIVPASGLNASLGHLPARPGKLALVSPSIALCRTVLDWAEPNGVGFSHIVGTGLEGDLDAGIVLDMLAREPGVGAILLDVRHVRDRRAFLSAARAAAGQRPVVALHAGGRQRDPSGRHDSVFEAALRRVGVLRVTTMAELLAAAEVLTRARPPRTERLMIVSNAIGAGQLAADQAVRLGIPLADPEPSAALLLRMALPPQTPVPGLIWTGVEQPIRPAEAAAMVSALPEIGGIAVILAPTGDGDAAGVAALAACRNVVKMPLIACVLGETTGAGHRRTLADAGLPVFASPEQAVRAFAQLVALARARQAARELPSSRILRLAPDLARVRAIIGRARNSGRTALYQHEALDVLSAYGMPVVPYRAVAGAAEAADAADLLGYPATVKQCRLDPAAAGVLMLDLPDRGSVRRAAERLETGGDLMVQRQAGRAQRLRITVADDDMLGPAIGFGPGGRDRLRDAVIDLPPLNLALAAGLIARSPASALLAPGQGHGAADLDAVADALVRVSQLVVDLPEIAGLTIDPLFADESGVSAAEAWIGLRPEGEQGLTAIAPYPADLVEQWRSKAGDLLEIRPIRPEDAEAHAALVSRLTPEDIRYRFFALLRELPPEQIARMTAIDYDREMAIVAVRGRDTLGVARLVREPGGSAAEFAIVIDPAMKGTGLGAHLMRRIIDWGRRTGLAEINGQILADNARMLAFIRKLGFTVRHTPGEPEVMEARLSL